MRRPQLAVTCVTQVVLTNMLRSMKRALLIDGTFLLRKQLMPSSSASIRFVGFERKNLTSSFVDHVFRSVADKYDLMNDAMSCGVHRVWKDQFIELLDPLPGTRLLDVAGGTGDIAFRFIDRVKRRQDLESSVVVCDLNEEMMRVGQNRAKHLGYTDERLLRWVRGDAMKLPFEDNSFDAYTIAFGIRNVVDIEQALEEAHRVLRPGGLFLCLEFSRVENPLLERVYDWYSFQVIPVLGEILAGDWKSYEYLVDSIRQFPDQEDFKAMIVRTGFTLVDYSNLWQGIACVHRGYKK